MNKKGIIIAVVIIVLALIGFFAMRNKSANDTADTNTQQNSEVKSSTESTSLKNLLASGSTKKCTYSYGGDNNIQGTTYVSNGKMRADMTYTANDKTYVTHMIVDGKTSYSWMEGQTTGYKMDFEKLQENATKGSVNNTGQANVDPTKNIDFNCSNWSLDNASFTVPTNVTFTDFSALVPTGTLTGGAQNLEAACDALSEPAKSQCKAALQKK